jgi:hypothetical protein
MFNPFGVFPYLTFLLKMEQINSYKISKITASLSTVEKLKLIQQLTAQIESELKLVQPKPRKSLRGLWQGLNFSEEEIAEDRDEMWSNFPRQNI